MGDSATFSMIPFVNNHQTDHSNRIHFNGINIIPIVPIALSDYDYVQYIITW